MGDKGSEVLETGEERLDCGVVLRWAVKQYSLDFVAKEGTTQDDGSVVYTVNSDGLVTDFDKAEAFVSGWVKWDACMELWVGDDENNRQAHICGPHNAKALFAAISRAIELAAWKIPTAHSLMFT